MTRKANLAITAALIGSLGSCLGAGTAAAEPGGCLKYGAVGAVGGHLAHHHGVLGAAGGCAVGMYKRHEYRKQQREAARQAHMDTPATGDQGQ